MDSLQPDLQLRSRYQTAEASNGSCMCAVSGGKCGVQCNMLSLCCHQQPLQGSLIAHPRPAEMAALQALFRAALLPHPRVEALPAPSRYAMSAALPLAIFVAYHLINPDPRARGVFRDWRFLSLAGVLGTACTISYYVTGGSLLAAALTHWVPVCAWLFYLGGWQKLRA